MSDDTLRLERDFYRRILQLDEQPDITGLLEEALALIVEITGARKGYIELSCEASETFSLSQACSEDEVTDIRAAISGGIIAEAVATGQTIQTASALGDPRFSGRRSVRANRIEAVLCAPIGAPSLGVVYLQGSQGSSVFSEADQERVELLARHLAPRADRLLLRRQGSRTADHTREIRAGLRGAEGIIGRSRALADTLQQAGQIAPLDITVLLSGPTGSGKTALARLIADNSRRARGPFVALNCANLPEGLVESELFGAARGAHSTATRPTEGKVTAARGGTLFLDEVAELPLPAQAKLLQLLQSKTYYPLGESRPLTADVRIIAASHRALPEEVASGRFREDLMYRLDVFAIAVPGLSRRPEDISLLAEHFCAQAVAAHGLPPVTLSAAAASALTLAQWPGHIRQLANTVESAAVRAATTGAAHIEPGHLFPGHGAAPESASLSFQDQTHRFQQQLLRQTLEQCGWNVSKTARQLDLARSHIYNLIKQHDLQR